MPHRVKLDFEPLSLEETAKRLGIPKARAIKILTLVGAGSDALNGVHHIRRSKKKSTKTSKTFSR
jgi:hypothetical protein